MPCSPTARLATLRRLLFPAFAFLPVALLRAQAGASASDREEARAIFKELIEINTTQSVGSTRRAADAMAARLRAAGYAERDIAIVGPPGDRQNLIVRLRASTSAPKSALLLLAHTDVVEATREDWSSDPFTFREDSGAFYGRGAVDNKAGAAMLVANMVRYKREGYVPDRDVVLLLTTDEETDGVAGIQYVLKQHRDLIDAEFCLNSDGGGVELTKGRALANIVGASEKVFQNFSLEVRNRGGHSSLPRPDNAIYQLSNALARLATFRFPVQLNEVTRAMFARSARTKTGQLAADLHTVAARGGSATSAVHRLQGDPGFNSLLRTTCVATLLQGGHADNALPQMARATVNCRMFPGSTAEDVRRTLARVVGDSLVVVRVSPPNALASPASPVRRDLFDALDSLTAKHYPGAIVIPAMETGATDGLFLRNAGIPTYNTGAIAADPADDRAHGRDERVLQKSYYDATQFWYDLVRTLTSVGRMTRS